MSTTSRHALMRAEVTRYCKPGGRPTRFWSVTVNGELLAVIVYRKGAESVARTINTLIDESMWPVNPHANGSANKQMVKNMV